VSYRLFFVQVRTSYLYHLRQSLRKNLESSKQKNVCDIEENMINKVIKGCSALLEEKALRSCMIARLYQRVMAQTVSIFVNFLLCFIVFRLLGVVSIRYLKLSSISRVHMVVRTSNGKKSKSKCFFFVQN